ncbi:hypothetical protein ACF07Q_27825 [Nocardiopsis dassonvillei]|uniref:hypothetical protein n=1 Tax=Nocardiopsis dassonvillei TaxID=2014 RepID=UPI0036F6DAF3
MGIKSHPLMERFLALGLPMGDLVIAGSGPLLAHGLRWDISDIDVVARGEAWRRALSLGEEVDAPFGKGVKRVLLFDGELEIINGWFPEKWDVDQLIDGADIIEGVPFVPLSCVREWKTLLGRSKDVLDVKLIDQYMESQSH